MKEKKYPLFIISLLLFLFCNETILAQTPKDVKTTTTFKVRQKHHSLDKQNLNFHNFIGKFSPQEYKTMQIDYITKKANLTPTEATMFFPLFEERHEEERRIYGDRNKMIKEYNRKDIKEEEVLELLIKIDNKEIERAQMIKDYHKKLMKILSARKVAKIITADRNFGRHMLDFMTRGQYRPQKEDKK